MLSFLDNIIQKYKINGDINRYIKNIYDLLYNEEDFEEKEEDIIKQIKEELKKYDKDIKKIFSYKVRKLLKEEKYDLAVYIYGRLLEDKEMTKKIIEEWRKNPDYSLLNIANRLYHFHLLEGAMEIYEEIGNLEMVLDIAGKLNRKDKIEEIKKNYNNPDFIKEKINYLIKIKDFFALEDLLLKSAAKSNLYSYSPEFSIGRDIGYLREEILRRTLKKVIELSIEYAKSYEQNGEYKEATEIYSRLTKYLFGHIPEYPDNKTLNYFLYNDYSRYKEIIYDIYINRAMYYLLASRLYEKAAEIGEKAGLEEKYIKNFKKLSLEIGKEGKRYFDLYIKDAKLYKLEENISNKKDYKNYYIAVEYFDKDLAEIIKSI